MSDGREMTPAEQEKAYRSICVTVKKCAVPGCSGDVICESKWIRSTSVGWLDKKEERRTAACNRCDILYSAHADDCSLAIAVARSK